MYDYREGEHYEATKELDVKDIAALIRKELRSKVLPNGCKFSVRYVKGTGYRDINIHLVITKELMDLRYRFEGLHDYAWFYHLDPSLMTGEYEPLVPLALAYSEALAAFEAYNFYEAPIYGDGCSRRYFGGVATTTGGEL